MTTGEGDLKSAAPTLNWTQPLCVMCWRFKEGDKMPVALKEPNDEICCVCGLRTRDGIYIRIDPRTVRYADVDIAEATWLGESAPPAAERTAQRDAALEIRTRIIDILDECDRTVYAQQKWKVAHAGLQGWLFKVEAENPEIIKEIADASEGTESE